MATYSSPPPVLASAIAAASSRYGVPVDVLTGIWRVEAGSSYPNPYVNSIGYGGLFGTGQGSYLWSTERQADYAASILARLWRETGSLSAALLKYSGSGYSSVPGQVTSGGSSWGGTTIAPAPSAPPATGGVSRPGGGTTGGTDAGLHLPGDDQVWHFFGRLFGSVKDAASAPIGTARAVIALVGWLVNPNTWLRLFELMGGATLFMVGLMFFSRTAREAGSAALKGATRAAAATKGG